MDNKKLRDLIGKMDMERVRPVWQQVQIPDYSEVFESLENERKEEQRRKEKDSMNLEATARDTKEIKELLSSINETLDFLGNRLVEEAQLSLEQRKEVNKLMYEIKELIIDSSEQPDPEKERKMQDIIKKGFSIGGQVSMALMIEVLKYKAKEYGLPLD